MVCEQVQVPVFIYIEHVSQCVFESVVSGFVFKSKQHKSSFSHFLSVGLNDFETFSTELTCNSAKCMLQVGFSCWKSSSSHEFWHLKKVKADSKLLLCKYHSHEKAKLELIAFIYYKSGVTDRGPSLTFWWRRSAPDNMQIQMMLLRLKHSSYMSLCLSVPPLLTSLFKAMMCGAIYYTARCICIPGQRF